MLNRVQRWAAFIMVMSMLGVVLAACGSSGGAGTSATASTGGGAGTSATASTGGGAGTSATMASDATTSTGGAGTSATMASGATTSTGGGAASGAAASCPATAKGQKLVLWSPLTGPDGKFMTDLAARFSKENGQGITISHQPQPNYYDKLNAASTSNTLPDVAIVHVDQVATQVARHVLRPIPDDVLKMINVSEADFPAAAWKGGEVKGQRYTIPLDVHPMVMFYNKELFKAAGITTPPTNKADFEKAAEALHKGDVMGWSVTTGFPITQMFLQTLHQFGGQEFNADGTQVTWNSDAGVKALQYLKDAQGKYSKPNLPVDAGITAFKQGKSAIEWNGIWQTSNMTGQAYPNGDGAPVPQLGDTKAVWAGSHQFSLPNQKNVDAAKTAAAGCWIAWISANSADWGKAGPIPARKSVRDSEAFKAIQPQASIAPSIEYAFFPPAVPGITDAVGELEKGVIAVMANKETNIKKALDDSAAKGKQILDQNKQKYGGG